MPEPVDALSETPNRPMDQRSDSSLLRRLRRGEGDAATALYLRYAHRLLALTRKQASSELQRQTEPEDIVQSVFLSFFRKAASGMYDVPEGEELWNLLLVITLNKIRAKGNFFRAARRDVRRNAGPDFPENDPSLTADNDQALMELQEVIRELLAQLPPIYADIVSLRIAGHDLDAIAHETKRSRRTVERALQEFRDQLSALLTEEK